MVIRDKQTLRRCVKQAVRRAEVVETDLRFDVASGPLGVDGTLASAAQSTPFHPDAAALCAALDALDLPVYDLRRAQAEIDAYDRGAYLRELLDAMRARRVYVRVPLERAGEAFFGDDRFEPLLQVDAEIAFRPGRYGVNYEQAVREIEAALGMCGARALLIENWSGDALRYALLPLCEDNGCRLHIALRDAEQAERLGEMLMQFPSVRVLAWAEGEDSAERALIALAAENPRVLVRLSGLQNLGLALETLGTRFLAYGAQADRMELTAGRWNCFKEKLFPLLAQAYLPLARSGYELTSEAVAGDVRRLMGGCIED